MKGGGGCGGSSIVAVKLDQNTLVLASVQFISGTAGSGGKGGNGGSACNSHSGNGGHSIEVYSTNGNAYTLSGAVLQLGTERSEGSISG